MQEEPISSAKYFTKTAIPSHLIRNSLGHSVLHKIALPLIELLQTSLAIYEIDGSYAYELFTSNYCKTLSDASFNLCKCQDQATAIQSGKWLCHESCWTDCSKRSIEEKRLVRITCHGKIQMVGVPIFLDDLVIGSINVGYGNPPTDFHELKELSLKFKIPMEKIQEALNNYPQFSSEFDRYITNYLSTLSYLIGKYVDQALSFEMLKKEQNKFLKYLDLAGDITVVLDQNACINYINEPGAKLLNYNISEILGKNWFDTCILPERKEEIKKVFKETVKEKKISFSVYENPVLTKDGTQKLILWKNSTIPDRSGNLEASLSVGIDITHQRSMEKQIILEQQKMSSFIQTVPFSVTVVDKNGEITFANEHAKQILNLRKTSPNPMKYDSPEWLIEDINGEPLPNNKLPFQIVKSTQKPVFNIIHSIRYKSQKRKILSINASPIFDSAGNFDGMIASIEDITKKLQDEAELAKNRNIESLGVLAGGIAHDFNNILTIIMGNLSLADLLLESKDINQVKNVISEAQNASIRAQKLTKQLLTFSKGGAPTLEKISIQEMLSEIITFTLSGSNSKPDLQIDDDLWPVDIDSDQISQVIQNLVLNASQAMENGGLIKVVAKNITPTETKLYNLDEKDYVMISIQDFGCGIDPQILPKIYDPYFTTKPTGTGLGLSICYSIMKQHHGEIQVKSKLHEGTTFFLFIPKSNKSSTE
ncbi:Adaptive-response sensory-kinase SasA [Candidatus Lokiarchaeum ossiferum]|uniref:Adaptive-response sensory-kinase SasA n=1 Tax=Candidatus Lokiarchaeum ossiferum TaxID=2951803 RepID=A0ABY6HUA2_9ARCH|nr:Adaptive-response sensory-kinase SasA [Candidatus Lokiarchaeum sp. B-35]